MFFSHVRVLLRCSGFYQKVLWFADRQVPLHLNTQIAHERQQITHFRCNYQHKIGRFTTINIRYCSRCTGGFPVANALRYKLHPIRQPVYFYFHFRVQIKKHVENSVCDCENHCQLTCNKDWYGFKASDTQNLLNLHNVFNSGVIDKVVPFPSQQESRQLLGDQKIYAVCELCETGKNCLYIRESV